MNIKALIVTLALGTSSVALASPEVRDHRTEPTYAPAPALVVQGQLTAQADIHAKGFGDSRDAKGYGDSRDARWNDDHRPMRPVFVPQPVTLASAARINGRDVIRVSDTTRAFTKLELKSNSGRTELDKVMIQFGNGQMQTIDCNKQLSGSESFSIDLAGNARNIKKIVLVGKSGRRASLDVIAV